MPKENSPGRYERITVQLADLFTKTRDPLARMSTTSAVLYHKLDHVFWCGFYRLVDEDLIVGPYQGPLACQVLTRNKGVCWASIREQKAMVVPDVEKFPGHIACDARSRSEIVIPVKDENNQIIAVLDIDSKELSNFSDEDAFFLEKIVQLIYK
ncbi:MAG: GAF domain-containing protein [Bacteroidota bacterium]